MANPPIRHLEDRDGQSYDFVAVIPSIDVEASTLAEGAGATGSAEVDDQTGAVTLKLGVPRGDTGSKGDKGDTGAAGRDGVDGKTGPKGDKGDKGETGTSVSGVSFDADGGLTVSMSDGTSVEFGGVTTAIAAAQRATTSAAEAASAANGAADNAKSVTESATKAERDRANAETSRDTSENARVTAEQQRVDAESKRASDFEANMSAWQGQVNGISSSLVARDGMIQVVYDDGE